MHYDYNYGCFAQAGVLQGWERGLPRTIAMANRPQTVALWSLYNSDLEVRFDSIMTWCSNPKYRSRNTSCWAPLVHSCIPRKRWFPQYRSHIDLRLQAFPPSGLFLFYCFDYNFSAALLFLLDLLSGLFLVVLICYCTCGVWIWSCLEGGTVVLQQGKYKYDK